MAGICVEITEALCVYLSSLEAGSTPELIITIEPQSAALGIHSCHTKCKIQVKEVPTFFLDGNLFLQKLASSSKNFREFSLSFHHLDVVQLICCRHSFYSSSTAKYSIVGWEDGNQKLWVKSSFEQEANPAQTNFIAFTILVPQSCHGQLSENCIMKSYLQLVHIISPEIYVKYRAYHVNGDLVDSVDYTGTFRHIARTPFKLSTTLQHYLPLQSTEVDRRLKLRLLKGGVAVLPLELPYAETSISGELLITCFTALVPAPPTATPKLLVAQDFISHVHVNVFGPTRIPLLFRNSLELFLPSLWANWSQYGIQLEMDSHRNFTGLMPSLAYKIKNTQASATRILHIFLFLEYTPVATIENNHWQLLLDVLGGVRETFYAVVSKYSERMTASVHAALNKFLFNFAANVEVKCRMERALPVLAEAVASIVHHSSNRTFQNKAKEMLQVGSGAEQSAVKDSLQDMLSRLANLKLGLNLQSVAEHQSNAAPSGDTDDTPTLGDTARQLDEDEHLEGLQSVSEDFHLLSDPQYFSSGHAEDSVSSSMEVNIWDGSDQGRMDKTSSEKLTNFGCVENSSIKIGHNKSNCTSFDSLIESSAGNLFDSLETVGSRTNDFPDFDNTCSTLTKKLTDSVMSVHRSNGNIQNESQNFDDLELELDFDGMLSSGPACNLHEISDEKTSVIGCTDLVNDNSRIPGTRLGPEDQLVPQCSPNQSISSKYTQSYWKDGKNVDIEIANKEEVENGCNSIGDLEDLTCLPKLTHSKQMCSEYPTLHCSKTDLVGVPVKENLMEMALHIAKERRKTFTMISSEIENESFRQDSTVFAVPTSQDSCQWQQSDYCDFDDICGMNVPAVVHENGNKKADCGHFEDFESFETMEDGIFESARLDISGVKITESERETRLEPNAEDITHTDEYNAQFNLDTESHRRVKRNTDDFVDAQLYFTDSEVRGQSPNTSEYCCKGQNVDLRREKVTSYGKGKDVEDDDIDFCLLGNIDNKEQEAFSDFSDLETMGEMY